MKLYLVSVIIGLVVQSTLASRKVNKARNTALLINPDAQPDLPTARVAQAAADAAGLNITDVQGDVLIGMKKNKELFFFFGIKNAADFKSKLSSNIAPLITSTNALLPGSTPPNTAVNIAFSKTGLDTLGILDDLGDSSFDGGQFTDATALGDPGTRNWVPGFAGTNIHGVLLLASGTVDGINSSLATVQGTLGDSISEIYRLQGAARPGEQQGHEHFGFMDGISQPAVIGFTPDIHPGQMQVPAGDILLGEDKDLGTRPDWARGGSFLAFRQLQQKVPEFDKYLVDNALNVPGLSAQENVDLLGARFIGRWKSGAPIDLAPLQDNPILATDVNRNNNFTFDHPEIPGFDIATNQTFCPFSAHIRKSRPRDDFPNENTVRPIMRAGIPYGPEVTEDEKASNTSSSDPSLERGLAFVSYQSNLTLGFRFIQQNWVDNANFFFNKTPHPGVDPIIGRDSKAGSVAPADNDRMISGSDPLDKKRLFTLDIDFVVSRGGEYFFSPPISALTGKLAQETNGYPQ